MNEIARIEPASRAPMMAGGRPAAIVPQSMEDAYRLATAVCKAGMAPRGLETPEKAMVAILHGLEIGLTPMAALQRIAVVNGRPTIWGDGAVGLVRGSGLCEWISEAIEGQGDAQVAVCETKRRHEPKSVKRTFSVADAKKAGLWGKSGPWQQFPTRMLAMRARAFCLRDVYADVLGGLYIKEEIDNEAETDRATQTRRAPVPPAVVSEPAPAQLEHRPQEAAPVRKAPVPPGIRKTERPSFEQTRDSFADRAKSVTTTEELGAAWNEIVEPHFNDLVEQDQDELLSINRMRSAELPGDDEGGEAGEP